MTLHPESVAELTQARLREVLRYEPETGRFFRLVGRNAGKECGNRHTNGYRCFQVDGRMYLAHRLAWLYIHGELPSLEIDHINRDRADNRIANLRLATTAQNGARKYAKNKTGHRGVSRHRPKHNLKRPYSASIRSDGKRHSLGYFATPEAAAAAYQAASASLHGEFAYHADSQAALTGRPE